MMRDWHPDVMYPDLSTPAGLRTMLTARYQHLELNFTMPAESGLFEASWKSAKLEADSEEKLLRLVLEELQDCGSERHDWFTVSEKPDPANPDNVLRTQRLECIYCDSRERVITVPSLLPGDSKAQTARGNGNALRAD